MSDYETENIKISSFAVSDVNSDGVNELVIAYCYPYDKSKEDYQNYYDGEKPSKYQFLTKYILDY